MIEIGHLHYFITKKPYLSTQQAHTFVTILQLRDKQGHAVIL